MSHRIRAQRVPHPDGGFEVVFFLDTNPVQVMGYMPITDIPSLILDLGLAVRGETIHLKEKQWLDQSAVPMSTTPSPAGDGSTAGSQAS